MKAVAAYVDGTVAPDLDAHGQPMLDDDALILVNGSPRPVTFTIPQVGKRCAWRTELDSFDPGTAGMGPTGTPAGLADPARIGAGDHLTVRQRSLILLLAPNPAPARHMNQAQPAG